MKNSRFSKVPERFLWAAALLNIKPSDNILEIGCGTGLLAEQICTKLTNGTYTAIDKSEPMIEKARKRNQRFLFPGNANFVVSEFTKANLPSGYFDHIVAFNVNFFWKSPAPQLEIVKNALKPDGKLYIFYQAPFEIDLSAAEPIIQKLKEHSFTIIHSEKKKFSPTSAFCIISQAPGV